MKREPLYVRIPANLKRDVEGHAKDKGMTLNAATQSLLDAGLLTNHRDAVLLNVQGVRAALIEIGNLVSTRGGMIGQNMLTQFRAAAGDNADLPFLLIGSLVTLHSAPGLLDGTAVGCDTHRPLLETYLDGLNSITPKEGKS